jgi:hypothetical protein
MHKPASNAMQHASLDHVVAAIASASVAARVLMQTILQPLELPVGHILPQARLRQPQLRACCPPVWHDCCSHLAA